MSSVTFRGASLRAGNWKNEEADGIDRLKFMALLTRPAMRDLGHEDVFFDVNDRKTQRILDSAVGLSVKRSVPIERFAITPNGLEQHKLELDGIEMEYEAYTVAPKGDDESPEGHVKISVSYAGPFGPIDKYRRTAKLAEGQLVITLDKDGQMKLDEQPEVKTDGPALASAREVDGSTRKK